MKKDLLVYINTYKRYDSTLSMCILSIINQTYKFDKFIIFDDNKPEFARDLRKEEHYAYLFDLMTQKGINWEYRWGKKRGAHFNHEDANMEGFKYAFFIDDDCILEPDCIENLMKEMKDDIGAVGGLILQPPTNNLPINADNKIDNLYLPNIQWFKWTGKPREVEHIYSSFLYRCNIVHHDLRLSSVVFRGETMFTHSLFLKGYKLIITPNAITWHFQSKGGIHDNQKVDNWNHDQYLFEKWLDFKKKGKKIYVLNNGLGDHYIFRQVITPDKDDIIACCYPEVFKEYPNIISIAEAERLVDTKDYDIYRFCLMNNWRGTLQTAYNALYEHINKQR